MPTYLLPRGRHANLTFVLKKQQKISVRIEAASQIMAYVVTDDDFHTFMETGTINYVTGHARTTSREFEVTLPEGKYHILTVNNGTVDVPVFCEFSIG